MDNLSQFKSGLDICCCWKLLHISGVLPRVPLLVNTPAVWTKWSSASEMSKLLKEKWADTSATFLLGLALDEGAYPASAFWLMREYRQSSPKANTVGNYGWPMEAEKTHTQGLKSEKGLSFGIGWWMSPKTYMPPSLWNEAKWTGLTYTAQRRRI